MERDEKRQRMVEELERREAEASRARTEAASTAATLQREMERLRRVAAEKAMAATAAAEARRKESMERVAEGAPAGDAGDAVLQDRLARTLKVSWASKVRRCDGPRRWRAMSQPKRSRHATPPRSSGSRRRPPRREGGGGQSVHLSEKAEERGALFDGFAHPYRFDPFHAGTRLFAAGSPRRL